MPNKNKIPITGFFIILTISSLFIFWMKNKEDTFADEIISDASVSFKSSLNDFLNSVELSINELNSNIEQAGNGQLESESLNVSFSKMIMKDKYLKGVILTNSNFSYMIYRDNSTWATTYDLNVNDSLVNWKRLNNNLEVVSEWTDTYNFFPDDQRLVDIVNQLKSGKFIWKTSKSMMPDKRDLLSNIFQTVDNDGEKVVAALIFSTKEMSKHFVSILKFKNPLVSIIASNNEIVTPVVTSDTSVVSAYMELGSEVKGLVHKWKDVHNSIARSYSFEKFNRIYWTRIDGINPNIGVEGFAVTISADDLAETERKQEMMYLYASLFFLTITAVLIFVFFKKKKTSIAKEAKNDGMIPLSEKGIQELIKKGETGFVEFKSSMRWDYREGKVNKVLENVILKSIAAFANAKGGTLLIGVSDELEILGLEKDFGTLKKQDADYFELHLRKLINNQYGIAFSNENLLMGFPKFDGKTICSVQVKASGSPVFLKTRNKQGNETEKFYVRSGNASQEISSLKEVNEYINARFDN